MTDSELERIAEERRTIMDNPDLRNDAEDLKEYERLGEEYDREVDRNYSND